MMRPVPAGQPRTIDVFDGDGRVLGSVRLPENRRLQGSGDGSVHLSRPDPLDFVWLERYELPVL